MLMGTIEDKLKDIGISETNLPYYVEILSKASTPQEVGWLCGDNHLGAGMQQFMYHAFKKLAEKRPEIIAEAEEKLGKLGVPPEIVHDYFTTKGDMPSIIFVSKYEGKVPEETREKFIREADKLVLRRLQEYIGVDIKEGITYNVVIDKSFKKIQSDLGLYLRNCKFIVYKEDDHTLTMYAVPLLLPFKHRDIALHFGLDDSGVLGGGNFEIKGDVLRFYDFSGDYGSVPDDAASKFGRDIGWELINERIFYNEVKAEMSPVFRNNKHKWEQLGFDVS